jgi:hypothetical protein
MARRLLILAFLSTLMGGALAGPLGPSWAHGAQHPDDGGDAEADAHGGERGREDRTRGERSGEARTVEIEVSEYGFDGNAGAMRVRLTEGEPVVLRFLYGDGAHGHENAHIIEVGGLGLKTGLMDASNPVEELRFTPETSGTFTFRCVYLCHGHANLQQGILRVGPAATLATELLLEVQSEAGPALLLVASVRDTRGRPVSGAPLHFLVESSLFRDMLDIGEGVTDLDGEAVLSFTPTVAGPTRFEARFEGQDVFEASKGAAEHRVVQAVPGPLVDPEGLDLPWAGTWIILVLVAGVWLTYAFALSRLRRLAKL